MLAFYLQKNVFTNCFATELFLFWVKLRRQYCLTYVLISLPFLTIFMSYGKIIMDRTHTDLTYYNKILTSSFSSLTPFHYFLLTS